MDALSFAARLLIGGILIAAATPKLLAPLHFQQIVMQFAPLPHGWARPFGRALPLLEIALGMLLLAGIAVRLAALAAAALFAGFAVTLLLSGDAGKRDDCGCFGRLQHLPRPWLVAQDVALALISSLAVYDPGLPFRLYELAGHTPGTHAVLLGFVLATLAVSCAVGYFARWRAPTGEKGGKMSKEGYAA